MGTAGFYAWANDNPRIALVDSRIAHNADLLAATPKFVAINAGLQVDVAGNVNSTSHRGRVVSGVGGAGDFARAGSRGEASIIAILSTTKDGASTVVPRVEAISIPSALVTHIVTEHGIAAIRGLDAARLRAAIRAIAAPQHRAQLD